MKKTNVKRFSVLFALAVLMGALMLLAISAPTDHRSDDSELIVHLTADDGTLPLIKADGKSDYTIIFSSDDIQLDYTLAQNIQGLFSEHGIFTVQTTPDLYQQTPSAYEILIGQTVRDESVEFLAELEAACKNSDDLVYGYAVKGEKLLYLANSSEAFDLGMQEFIDVLKESSLAPSRDLKVIFIKTRAEYEEELRQKAEAERLAKLEELKTLIGEFELSDFGDVTMNTSMPQNPYGTPTFYPQKGEHPRLTVTSYMLDDIREFLEREEFEYVANNFWEYANSNYTGILPPAKVHTSGREGYHNVDEAGLMKIEAMALAYLLTEDEIYGYSAVLAMKNYLTTFDFGYIYSDQCREIGRLIFCASEVYDWCYNLLTEADKEQFKLGVVDIWSGSAREEFKGMCASGNRFMEVGFPPTGQGSVSGHGSERQILRDCFAASIAFYDEDPTWYEFVAGRVYNEYVPFRNYYYESGTYPQGINLYAAGRHSADVWSAWLMYTSVGDIAYNDTLNGIVKSFYSYELPNGTFFGTGDSGRNSSSTRFNTCAYVIMGLYKDEYLYSWLYQNTKKFMKASASNLELSYSHIAILLASYFTDEDHTFEPISKYENIPTVSYNPHPIGQVISRYEWENPDAPAVFMKIGERTTANHEHADAGTFQIFYKGLYSGESGSYDKYGSTHFTYYHQATVAHNGLLVYNPAKRNSDVNENGEPVTPKLFWYTGGQNDPGESSNLEDWLQDTRYDTGSVTSVDYKFDSLGRTDYVYLAGDISKAYPFDDVSYVGRSMLAVYTDDENAPLYFLVYDRIESTDASYEKRFLLHLPTEPVVDEEARTVSVTANEGKLVLFAQKGFGKVEAIGGKGRTYLINGVQCATTSNKDDSNWGRIEITAPTDAAYTEFLNVMYVSPASSETAPVITPIETEFVVGSRIDNTVALFTKELDPTCEKLEFSTEGKGLLRYVIVGVYSGTWKISVDGVSAATVYTTDGANSISFYAPAGKVTVAPGPDVPPANGGRIIYNAFGGIVPDDAPLTFVIGVPVTLPTDIVKDSSTFLGWYTDPSFDEEYRITEVVGTAKGRFNVYAKYKAAPFVEDYENVSINLIEATKKIGKMSYGASGKTGTYFKTETNGENTYLVIHNFEKDPAINYAAVPKEYMGDDRKLTISVSLAKRANMPGISSNMRLRASSTSNTVSAISTTSSGVVKMGGKVIIANLSEHFTNVNVTIDFENGTMTAYENNGSVIATTTFAPPKASGLTSTLEWFSTLSTTFNWYMPGMSEEGEMLIDNLTVYSGDFVPIPEVIPEGKGKISYEMNGKTVPAGAPQYYNVGEVTPIPTPQDEFDEFMGWYTSPDYSEESKITEIPADATGEITLYARWLGVYMNEDFEDVDDAEYIEQNGSFGQISVSSGTSKIGSSVKTETDDSGNKYLVFTRGEKDPHLTSKMPIAPFASSANAITVQVDLALVDGVECIGASYRIRAKIDGKNKDLYVFTIKKSGEVTIGDAVIATLTNDFTTITVTVSWDTGMLVGYVNGEKAATVPFSSDTYDLEWLAQVTASLNFYSNSGGAVKLDNFYAYSDAYNLADVTPEGGFGGSDDGFDTPDDEFNDDGYGKIVYELAEGALDEKAPLYFSKTEPTTLIAPTKADCVFLGWYTSPDLNEASKITEIPATDAETFTVYAKWLTVFVNEKFDDLDDIEYVEKNGAFGTIYATAKAGVTYKTEHDEKNGKYLTISITGETEVDPHVSKTGTPSTEFAGTAKAVTASASFGLIEGRNAISSSYRMRSRVDGQKLDLYLFSISSSGEVWLSTSASGILLATLSEDEMTNISVTVNWDTGMLSGYVNGEFVAEMPFDTESRGIEWFSGVTNHVYFYFKGSDGALKMDDFYTYASEYIEQ